MRCVSFLYPTSLIVNMLPDTPSLSFKFLAGLYEWNSNNERCFLNSWFLDWWQTSVTGAIYVTPPLILMYLYTCIHIGGLSLIVIYYSQSKDLFYLHSQKIFSGQFKQKMYLMMLHLIHNQHLIISQHFLYF